MEWSTQLRRYVDAGLADGGWRLIAERDCGFRFDVRTQSGGGCDNEAIIGQTKEPDAVSIGFTTGFMPNAEPSLLDLQHLAVLVVAAAGAHAVRQLHFAALGADGARGHLGDVVSGTTGVRTSTAGFSFGYCHGLLPFLHGLPCRGSRKT